MLQDKFDQWLTGKWTSLNFLSGWDQNKQLDAGKMSQIQYGSFKTSWSQSVSACVITFTILLFTLTRNEDFFTNVLALMVFWAKIICNSNGWKSSPTHIPSTNRLSYSLCLKLVAVSVCLVAKHLMNWWTDFIETLLWMSSLMGLTVQEKKS